MHKIESLNAFTACEADDLHTGTQFFICDDCGVATESHLSELPKILKKSTKEKTFKPLRWKLEINGLCNQCS